MVRCARGRLTHITVDLCKTLLLAKSAAVIIGWLAKAACTIGLTELVVYLIPAVESSDDLKAPAKANDPAHQATFLSVAFLTFAVLLVSAAGVAELFSARCSEAPAPPSPGTAAMAPHDGSDHGPLNLLSEVQHVARDTYIISGLMLIPAWAWKDFCQKMTQSITTWYSRAVITTVGHAISNVTAGVKHATGKTVSAIANATNTDKLVSHAKKATVGAVGAVGKATNKSAEALGEVGNATVKTVKNVSGIDITGNATQTVGEAAKSALDPMTLWNSCLALAVSCMSAGLQILAEATAKSCDRSGVVHRVMESLKVCLGLGTGWSVNSIFETVFREYCKLPWFQTLYTLALTAFILAAQRLTIRWLDQHKDINVFVYKTINWLQIANKFVIGYAWKGFLEMLFEVFGSSDAPWYEIHRACFVTVVGMVAAILVSVGCQKHPSVLDTTKFTVGLNIGWIWMDVAAALIEEEEEDRNVVMVWLVILKITGAVLFLATVLHLTLDFIDVKVDDTPEEDSDSDDEESDEESDEEEEGEDSDVSSDGCESGDGPQRGPVTAASAPKAETNGATMPSPSMTTLTPRTMR